jgi:dimethylargininase
MEAKVAARRFGCTSMVGTLERVLVRPPLPQDVEGWRDAGWRAAPDFVAAAREHEAFCSALEEAGAEVVVSRHETGNPDALYPYDPVLVGVEGAVLLRPGKELRRGEPAALAPELEAAGVPVAATVSAPALAEGGDTLWLDDETLLVGIGYRTNEEALVELRKAFPGVDIVPFDLPHWNGDGEVLHLLSFISPLDRDLALVYPRLAPVRLLRLLAERAIRVVEVPEEEFASQGPNVLALGPRRALALDGNPETRRRMEQAGVDVAVYRGDEISRKGDGGPTCLTRPLLRT